MNEVNHPEVGSPPTIAGTRVDLDNDADRREVIEKAFDFRGDVVIATLGGETVEGYLFDRRERDGAWELRVLTPSGDRWVMPYGQVASLAFSAKDPAEGKSWENWLKRYVEKKKAGESASLDPDPLD